MTNTESMKAVKRNAMPGMQILLTHYGQLAMQGFTSETTGVLTRKQSDGMWFADFAGEEFCVGSGYDFRLVLQ